MAQTLLDLAKLITESATNIDAVCKARGITFPSLDEPFDPAAEGIRTDPEVIGSLSVLAASAEQLVATAWIPALTLFSTCLSFHMPTALRVASECNVAEALREAGPQGLHVNDIAKGHTVQPDKLGRVLRLLATRHFIREVSPDVFAANKLTSLLDTGKPFAEVRANPRTKHERTNGMAAFAEHLVDDCFMIGPHTTDLLLDSETGQSDSPTANAFRLALGESNSDIWAWFDQPQNAYRRERFSIAMGVSSTLMPEAAILTSFDWKSLPSGAKIVDVGGGVGNIALVLDNALNDVKIVVQDRAKVIEDAEKFWQQKKPGSVASGKVTLQPHNFFEAQPHNDADVFVLRHILHDFPDTSASKILKQLRAVAKDTTRLIFVEQVLLYACDASSANKAAITTSDIPGAAELGGPPAPAPLLGNLGVVNLFSYLIDMQMLAGLNGRERTLAQFDVLLTGAGWKIERVSLSPGTWKHVTARPIT